MTEDIRDTQRPPAGAPPDSTPDPAAVREDIARTRKDLGDTLEALAAKADVGARMRDKAAALTEQARLKASRAADAAQNKVAELGQRASARTTELQESVTDTPPQTVARPVGVARSWQAPLVVAAATVAVAAGWLARRRWRTGRRRR